MKRLFLIVALVALAGCHAHDMDRAGRALQGFSAGVNSQPDYYAQWRRDYEQQAQTNAMMHQNTLLRRQQLMGY